MNGEVKSYRLNDPLKWDEFKSMPDDLKVVYIQALRNKYNVPDMYIHQMMGIGKDTFIKELKKLNLLRGKQFSGRKKWDKEGFYAWANGVDVPTTVPEEEPAEEPIQEPVIISEEPEAFMEEDLPFEELDPIPVEEYKPVPQTSIPCNGSMNFKCPADQALNTLAQILGKANCHISIMWRVVEGDEDNG